MLATIPENVMSHRSSEPESLRLSKSVKINVKATPIAITSHGMHQKMNVFSLPIATSTRPFAPIAIPEPLIALC